jgi:hypothetical protein
MKKITKLALIVASIAAAFASVGFFGSAPSPVKAEGESSSLLISSSSPSSEIASSEESSSSSSASEFTIEGKTIDQWKNEIMEYQILGVSVSTLITLLIYWILHYASKGDIKKALGVLSDAKAITQNSLDTMNEIKSKYDITDKNYDTAISAMEQTNVHLSNVEDKLTAMAQENKSLHDQNDSLKEILLTMCKNSPDLVKSGAYKKILEITGGNSDGKK